ncbi:MAG: quinolinate synthase NadA, partial [Halobacteriovoraceae bacterium]|nr:quinolinate synthase NadA [Halobacteriovoraceae bacterium]
EMVVYDPNQYQGGLTTEELKKAKVILWYGYCSVHQGFTAEQIDNVKQEKPNTTVIVHPECSFEVVQAADLAGSTSYILEQIEAAASGSSFAVGTEINLVNRLAEQFPDKDIFSLSPYQCLCTTMYRVRPRWLLASFRSMVQNKPINVIKVPDSTTESSLKALERMLAI